ncbi:MAG TPA: membrane protein insertion efficiency factor YidD [Bacteroidales bacterium]|nr:membrane protein insertion efficiency factor YidD [Bacteroidales bacterium]
MRYSLSILILFVFAAGLRAQPSDVDLLKSRSFTVPKFESQRVVKFGISGSKSPVVKYNPVSLTFSSLLFTYQKWLSPQVSADCLYSPSCSEYSKQLFKRYGFIGGIITSSDRLMRCDRISATTINPISIGKDGKVHETTDRYVLKKQK